MYFVLILHGMQGLALLPGEDSIQWTHNFTIDNTTRGIVISSSPLPKKKKKNGLSSVSRL
jgi:hypothetical protein